jgi:SPP1 family holin
MNRTQSIVSAIVVLVMQVAALLGYTLDAGTVTAAVSAVVVIAATLWALWKNHNFTAAAQKAQQVLDDLKEGE